MVLVVLAGAGTAVALVLSSGGQEDSESAFGLASRDELVGQTLLALSEGNVDRLLALSGPEDLQSRFSDCTANGSADDPKRAREVMRRSYQEVVDRMRRFELLNNAGRSEPIHQLQDFKITGDSTTTIEKGTQVGACTMKTAVSTVEVRAKVGVRSWMSRPGYPQATKIGFLEFDGRWFLVSLPTIKLVFGCRTVAMGSQALRDLVRATPETENAMERRCTEDVWPDDAIYCLAKAKNEREVTACLGRLPTAQRDKLTKDLAAARPAALPASAPKPSEPEPKPDGTGSAQAPENVALPESCVAYGEQVDKLLRCRNLAAQRKQIAESFATLKQGWEDIPVKTEAMRASFDKICTDGVQSVVELRKQCR